jgi:hypothetical protein
LDDPSRRALTTRFSISDIPRADCSIIASTGQAAGAMMATRYRISFAARTKLGPMIMVLPVPRIDLATGRRSSVVSAGLRGGRLGSTDQDDAVIPGPRQRTHAHMIFPRQSESVRQALSPARQSCCEAIAASTETGRIISIMVKTGTQHMCGPA